jgi:hypothetical protein
MATKRDNLLDPQSCFSRAGLDEQIFVLRAKDVYCAVPALKTWAIEASRQSKHADKMEGIAALVTEFEAQGHLIEAGRVQLQKLTPHELLEFMVAELAPQYSARVRELEAEVGRLKALDDKRLEHAVSSAALDVAGEICTLDEALAELNELYPETDREMLHGWVKRQADALHKEEVDAEAITENARKVQSAADELAKAEPPKPAPVPQDPPVPPNHHPVA